MIIIQVVRLVDDWGSGVWSWKGLERGVTGLFKGSGKLVKSRSVGSCYDDGGRDWDRDWAGDLMLRPKRTQAPRTSHPTACCLLLGTGGGKCACGLSGLPCLPIYCGTGPHTPPNVIKGPNLGSKRPTVAKYSAEYGGGKVGWLDFQHRILPSFSRAKMRFRLPSAAVPSGLTEYGHLSHAISDLQLQLE